MVIVGNITHAIWLRSLPNVNRIYSLINDIYIVRAFKEYDLEEELFAKLIFLFRSRELLIKYTRMFGNPYSPEFIYFKEKHSN